MSVEELDRWAFIEELDCKYLIGGVVLSELTAFLVRDADTAFCSGGNLAAILAAQAAMECHLRYEYGSFHNSTKLGFYQLIEQSPLDSALKQDLHRIRQYRNRWVHVSDPSDDCEYLQRPEYHEEQLSVFARFTIERLRQVIYLEQCI